MTSPVADSLLNITAGWRKTRRLSLHIPVHCVSQQSLVPTLPDDTSLEFTIWFVPSLISNAVAVSLVGVLLGPFYPICMRQCSRVLPRKFLSSSIGKLDQQLLYY